MIRKAIFLALFLALAAPAAFAGSKTASSLDRLFGALHATADPDEANRLTSLIWLIWNHAEDPETDRLMTEGRKALEQLDFDTALARFGAVIEREPKFAEGWNKRATLYYVMGRYRDSIRDIDHVLALEARHFGALAGLGMNHEALGDDRRALDAWRRALKVNPYLQDAQIRVKALEASLRNRPI
ncbi:MAG: tetratricopeptide repeat protein [Alphaproteobacteria bacterium]